MNDKIVICCTYRLIGYCANMKITHKLYRMKTYTIVNYENCIGIDEENESLVYSFVNHYTLT
jgi:hypothetical protein